MENAAMLEEGNKNTDILFFSTLGGKASRISCIQNVEIWRKKVKKQVNVGDCHRSDWQVTHSGLFLLPPPPPHPPTTLFRNKWRLTEKRWMVFKRISLLLASSSLWSSMCSCFFLISFHFFYHHLILQISARRDVVRGKMEIFIWTQAK